MIVVGAGIIGAACADALAQAGLAVTLLDAGTLGGASTGAAMGHIVVMDDSPAQFALTRYSGQLWAELVDDLPVEAEVERAGTIWIAADEAEMAAVRAKHAFYSAHGVAVEVLDAAGLARLEPELRPGLAGGLLVPGDKVVYPPCVAQFLVQRAVRRGAQVRSGTPVERLAGGGVRLAHGERLSADVVINAAGVQAPELTPGLPIRPRKGHLIITDRYPGFVRRQLVELGYLKSAHRASADSVAFNIQPRATGQVLIGSSRQYGDSSTAIDHALLARMVRRAIEYMPAIARLSATRVWTGLRPATPDKLPLIGPWPGTEGLFIAAGHEGLGITMALATARLLVDQILGRPTAIPCEPYLPARLPGADAASDSPDAAHAA